MRNSSIAVVLCFMALVVAPVLAYAGGTVKGVISTKASGAHVKINITKDQAICGKVPKFKENLVVSSSGGVLNAVVEIIGAGEAKPGKITVAQDGCRFNPHTMIMPAGSALVINNKDGLTHNFHSFGFENDPVNFSQPGDMKTKTVSGENFEVPEAVQIRCDIHEWMEGWVYVTESGSATLTNADGAFSISNVKPGSYKIKIWHEFFGEIEKDITVKDGDNVFNLSLAKK